MERSNFWSAVTPEIPPTASTIIREASEADPHVCPHCGYVNHPEATVRDDGQNVCNRCYLVWRPAC
jgi:hypothetical protein